MTVDIIFDWSQETQSALLHDSKDFEGGKEYHPSSKMNEGLALEPNMTYMAKVDYMYGVDDNGEDGDKNTVTESIKVVGINIYRQDRTQVKLNETAEFEFYDLFRELFFTLVL